MTTGELLSSQSSVSNVSALEHLQNIEGGGVIINSEKVIVKEDKPIYIEEKSDIIEISEDKGIFIEEADIIVDIIVDKGDLVNVL